MFDHQLAPILSDDEIERLSAAELATCDFTELDRHSIPPDLDDWAPGPYLAVVLSATDPGKVNGADAVILMRAHARQVAHQQAGYYRSIGEVATAIPTGEDGPALRSEEWYEYANLEVRAALTLTRRATDNEMGTAQDLVARLPLLWEALSTGSIDMRKALTIARGVGHLGDNEARKVVKRVLVSAPELTTGQIRARLRRLCLEADPDEAKKRTESAVEERRLVVEPADDGGTAEFHGYGAPIDRAAAIGRRINGLARSLKTAGDTRTMDQLRMDVFLDLLEGAYVDCSAGRGMIDLHVDLRTLASLSESPGDLAGFGPIHADIARQVAVEQRESEWRFTVTDDSGAVVHTGITRRRPTAAQRREVQARYRTCVFPGCRMPAKVCDVDHSTQWSEGGKTTVGNTAPLCEHDHTGRHAAGWTYRRLPDGRHEWTSRLGHTYVTRTDRPP